ncbi:MAG: M48 family metalloprotease [Gemmatimonadota bacterium]|nr:M48 family metalloprotease [Gemmatimonadota bacterium]
MTYDRTSDRKAYLLRPLRAREEAHRRAVLLGMGALIVFSTSPVFGHHLATRADALLAGRDHLFRLCLIALHLFLEPVHLAFHGLLLGGLVYAIWDRVWAWSRARRVLKLLGWNAPNADGALARAARAAGLPSGHIRVVDGLPNPAFTAGWWTPRVYVDVALTETLSHEELAVVLAHEGAHVARRDPLRLSMLRFLACTLFYLPALRRLADDAADEAEIAADDAAASGTPGRGPLILASAILAIAKHWGQTATASAARAFGPECAAVGFQRVDLLERRVRRLMGEDAPVGTHVTRRSLAGAGAALAAVWVSGLMMAHPLPAGIEPEAGLFGLVGSPAHSSESVHGASHGTHCVHHGAFALTHLFCLGLGGHPPGTPCPHSAAAHHRMPHVG